MSDHTAASATTTPAAQTVTETRQERPAYTLKVAQTKDEIEACYDIRIEVFSVEQGFPLETEIDEYDPISVHFLLTTPVPSPPAESSALISALTPTPDGKTTTEKPIGTIRFVPTLGKLTRLAIHKEYRKFGFGKVLVQGMEEYIRSAAAPSADAIEGKGELDHLIKEKEGKRVIRIKCHSQIPAMPFYAKSGYVSEGPEFDEDGAPHQLMVHELEIA